MYEDEVPVQEPRRPIRRWAWAALAVLMVVGGIRLNQYLRDPESGRLTGIMESDSFIHVTRSLFMNAGRVQSIPRDAEGAISRQVERELRDNGLDDILPVLSQIDRRSSILARQEGFAGPTIQISGTAKLDPDQILKTIVASAKHASPSGNRKGAFRIEAETITGRPIELEMFGNPDGKFSVSFRMMPKSGTALTRSEDLTPLFPRLSSDRR